MMLGIGLGVTQRQGGSQSFEAWVASIFAGGIPGVAYAPSPTTCFTDAGLTTPATVGGASGTVYVRDLSGNDKTLTVTNTILGTEGGRYYLACNGTTTGGVTAAIDFTATDKMTVWTGLRKISDAAGGTLIELSTNSESTPGSFGLLAPGGAEPTLAYQLRGTAREMYKSTAAAPVTCVLSVAFDIGAAAMADEIKPRVNGVAPSLTVALAGPAGTANFSNNPLYLFRRAGSSLPFNGFFYGGIVRGAASSVDQIAAGETYMALKAGVTL